MLFLSLWLLLNLLFFCPKTESGNEREGRRVIILAFDLTFEYVRSSPERKTTTTTTTKMKWKQNKGFFLQTTLFCWRTTRREREKIWQLIIWHFGNKNVLKVDMIHRMEKCEKSLSCFLNLENIYESFSSFTQFYGLLWIYYLVWQCNCLIHYLVYVFKKC